MTNKNKKQSRLFRFFDFNRDNRFDAVEEDTTPTLKRYFKLLGRRFWKLISLNIMMLPMVVPLLLAAYLYLGMDKTPTASNPLFSQLYGANLIQANPSTSIMLDIFGAQTDIPVYTGTATYIPIGIAILFLVVTFGWQNVGATYILRSMVRGEPVFLFSDYFYAVKRNLKQGFIMGVIDVLVMFLLVFDYMYFSSMASSFWIDVCYFAIMALAILYFFMRFYLYLMMVTFDLPIRKLFKNALIFTVLGFKRNIMAVLGIVLITAINIFLFAVFAITPLGIAIPLILPFLYYLSVNAFTAAYAAYPIIDRYMIEPYRTDAEDGEDASEENDGETVAQIE
ncbi:MAG: DUF624 domain-containing protein [Clostridia bacterium]|nr:DUF624 domain-containing protein [Clostridia bacterium]